MVTINELNNMSRETFVEELGGIFEHSPWIAGAAWDYRPFSSKASLQQTMAGILEDAASADKLALIRKHPSLGAKDKMSFTSTQEQKGAGLNQLSEEEFEQFVRLNEEYTRKFGFPFILAVKRKTKRDIYESLQERLTNDKEEEYETALNQIYQIAGFRLEEKIT